MHELMLSNWSVLLVYKLHKNEILFCSKYECMKYLMYSEKLTRIVQYWTGWDCVICLSLTHKHRSDNESTDNKK